MMSAMLASIFGLLLVLPVLVQTSGVFELRLENFNNHLTVDQSGVCCKDRSGQCAAYCNTYFRICLKHYQTSASENPSCTFGQRQTQPSRGNGAEQFTTIPFAFDFTWPETFSLIVEARHQPLPGKQDYLPADDDINTLDDQLLAQLTAHRTLKADANWTESTFTANSSQLTFAYRVVCDEKYYGAGCADLCRPRDDGFGHYTCTENGTRICLDGWTGPYCTQAICAAGCNTQRGYCDVPFECKCRTGWQGKDCSECIRYPGCRKGTCQMPWQCNCDEGWGGLFCDQDLNYCTHHRPCGNGGTCTNTGQGSYTCKCPDDFTGLNCEVRKDQCELEPCQNGGLCRSMGPGNYTCVCQEGFTGKHCDIPSRSCSDSPCQNGGLCQQSSTKGFTCQCKPGFEGRHCEKDRNDCETSPCKNGGRCLDLVNSFICTCPTGFTGATCQTVTTKTRLTTGDCTVTGCVNGGTCTANGHCDCPRGYEGPTCQQGSSDKCADSPCHHGASCEDLRGGDFVCHCPEGYGGKLCDSLDSNSLEDEASTARLLKLNEPSWTVTALCGLITSLVLVLILMLATAVICIRRNRTTRHPASTTKELPASPVNFSMNNFQKASPMVAKEWKPTVTYQTETQEDHYVLPKRINSNYVAASVYSGTGGRCVQQTPHSSSDSCSSNQGSPTDVYMKVMVTPPPSYADSHYQSPRRHYASSRRTMQMADDRDRFPEYELAENIRHQFVC